jgi:hypothetical protein
MTMRPSPEITFEIRRPLVELRIAIRHMLRDVRETWAFIRAAYRQHDVSAEERTLFVTALRDGRLGGETVETENFIGVIQTFDPETYITLIVERPGTANVQKRGPHYHNAVQA